MKRDVLRFPPPADGGHLPIVPGSNADYLKLYVESTLAFHGLRPHVADQMARVLAPKVVALELLPAALRREVERALRDRSP